MAESDPTLTPGADEGEGLGARIAALRGQLRRELWRAGGGESWAIWLVRSTAQLVALTIRGFKTDQLLLRASALTYVTAISVIPMLGVVIAIVGAIGGDETLIDFAIDQLTTVAPEVRETVRDYASKIDFRGFGTIGGAVVLGTAIFALRHLEATLNDIWGVVATRGWARRFSDYLAVMVVAPVSAGVAVSLASTVESGPIAGWLFENPLFAWVYGLGLTQLPLFVLVGGFTFLYWFFPNTEVRIRAAALGGVVAAILFDAARSIYTGFQIGAATYQAVFGALSAVPLILIWLYACWAIVLLGAEVAFATQNLPFARREMRSGEASLAEQEAVALEIAVAIGKHFREQLDPPNAENLADALDEPVRLIRGLCEDLEGAHLLRPVQSRDGQDAAYVPAAPLRELTVGAVLRAVRGDVDGDGRKGIPRDVEVTRTLGQLEGVWSRIADEATLESLCMGPESEGADPDA